MEMSMGFLTHSEKTIVSLSLSAVLPSDYFMLHAQSFI